VFYTADQSGTVVLRILQGRIPIKTLAIQVPKELPVGSKVTLSLRCDEAMRLEAKADVGGQELWATVEPPQTPRFDPSGDVEGLLESAEAVSRQLWGHRGEFYRREVAVLSASIREVVATDPDKLSVLCGRLQALVEEYRPDPTGGGLAPPLHHFEWELDSLRRVVFRASGSLMGMGREAWEARIADLEQRAQAAYEASDAIAWRRINNEVQALRETAHQEEFAAVSIDDPAYLLRRVMGLVRRANEVERELADFVPSESDEVKALQLAERDRLLVSLGTEVKAIVGDMQIGEGVNVQEARRKIDRAASELERIEAGVERIPSLGLVTEHGGGP
jgi:molecular chaperone DnaK